MFFLFSRGVVFFCARCCAFLLKGLSVFVRNNVFFFQSVVFLLAKGLCFFVAKVVVFFSMKLFFFQNGFFKGFVVLQGFFSRADIVERLFRACSCWVIDARAARRQASRMAERCVRGVGTNLVPAKSRGRQALRLRAICAEVLCMVAKRLIDVSMLD